jgi:hypothetical protein
MAYKSMPYKWISRLKKAKKIALKYKKKQNQTTKKGFSIRYYDTLLFLSSSVGRAHGC